MKISKVIEELEDLIKLLKTEDQDTICYCGISTDTLKSGFLSYENTQFVNDNCDIVKAIIFYY